MIANVIYIRVASFTDAWIETLLYLLKTEKGFVASFTDAWIETSCTEQGIRIPLSHLLQMRGLKLITGSTTTKKRESHLLQMRGLKLIRGYTYTEAEGRIFYRCVD